MDCEDTAINMDHHNNNNNLLYFLRGRNPLSCSIFFLHPSGLPWAPRMVDAHLRPQMYRSEGLNFKFMLRRIRISKLTFGWEHLFNMQELGHFIVSNLTQAKWITVTSNFCMISKNYLLLSLKLVSKYLSLQRYICNLFFPCSPQLLEDRFLREMVPSCLLWVVGLKVFWLSYSTMSWKRH